MQSMMNWTRDQMRRLWNADAPLTGASLLMLAAFGLARQGAFKGVLFLAAAVLLARVVVPVMQTGPNFVVNTLADTDDGSCDALGQGTGNHDCTLREAINAANAYGDGGVITFNLGDLAPGASGTLTYAAKLREGAQGAVENHAAISAALSDANPADNAASARFDVVLNPATLELSANLTSTERCRQPQVEVATGRLIGVEAIVCWNYAERGLLDSDSFMALTGDCET